MPDMTVIPPRIRHSRIDATNISDVLGKCWEAQVSGLANCARFVDAGW
jgi:hypothetical protein